MSKNLFKIAKHIDIDGLKIYYNHIDRFTYLKTNWGFCSQSRKKYSTSDIHVFYSIIRTNYKKSKSCTIEGEKFTLHLSNGKLHSLETYAYLSFDTKLYFINGKIISKEDWMKHPDVMKKLRLKKLNKIFFDV